MPRVVGAGKLTADIMTASTSLLLLLLLLFLPLGAADWLSLTRVATAAVTYALHLSQWQVQLQQLLPVLVLL